MARVSLLEGAVLDPGASAWAQLRLAEPVALAVGDRFVLRRPSPSETLGGGMVADVSGERMRRRREAVETLERRTAPTAASRLLAALDVPRTPDEAGTRSGLEAAERLAATAEVRPNGQAGPARDEPVRHEGVAALA